MQLLFPFRIIIHNFIETDRLEKSSISYNILKPVFDVHRMTQIW